MEQKLVWIFYLIIGFSLINASCEKKEELNIKTTYIYKNNTDFNLTLQVFNKKERKLIEELPINKWDSIYLIFYGDGIPSPPFFYDSNIDSIGDSISIVFQENKFVSYTEDTPNTILDNKNYLLKKKSKIDYRYQFIFSQNDFKDFQSIE